MRGYDDKRAVYYPSGDLAAGWFTDRVVHVLQRQWLPEQIGVNEAIELYQCKLILDQYPYFFEAHSLTELRSSLKTNVAFACKAIGSILSNQSIERVFDCVELQYQSQFWELVAFSGMWKSIDDVALRGLIVGKPYVLRDVLRIDVLVKRFDTSLRRALEDCAGFSAELILLSFGSADSGVRRINLPRSVTSQVIDRIMLDYLTSNECNLNLVRILAGWPKAACNSYRPSAEVMVAAKKRARELNDELFNRGTAITHSLSVVVSEEQRACKSVRFDGVDYELSFGAEWLRSFTDYATVLNNFIYVFDFVSFDGLLMIPAHKNEPKSLIERLGVHSLNEYPGTFAFSIRQNHALMEIAAYGSLLESAGLRLEDSIEWAFNEYIMTEFGIEGFGVHLPAAGASYLDKCKCMGPEIERILKCFTIYAERGEIDEDFFPHVTLKLFEDIPSLLKDKYAVPNVDFEKTVAHLFSDQSPLAYGCNSGGHCRFYARALRERVSVDDYPECYRPIIEQLVGLDLLSVGEGGALALTDRAHICKHLWDDGAIALFRHSERFNGLVADMAGDGFASYRSSLLTPDEAAYFNYMFNNALFDDSLALRNRYDHASFAVADPDAERFKEDYFRFLVLLICLMLKIVDELSCFLGKGGVEDFVDWPWIDEAAIEEASKVL